jgi:hypothetical protein
MSFTTRAIVGADAVGLTASLLLSGGSSQAAEPSSTVDRIATLPVHLISSAASGGRVGVIDIVGAGLLVLALGIGVFRLARRRPAA